MGITRIARRAEEKLGGIMRVRDKDGCIYWKEDAGVSKFGKIIRRGDGKREKSYGRHSMKLGETHGGVFKLTKTVKRLLDFDGMNDRHKAEDALKRQIRDGYKHGGTGG